MTLSLEHDCAKVIAFVTKIVTESVIGSDTLTLEHDFAKAIAFVTKILVQTCYPII